MSKKKPCRKKDVLRWLADAGVGIYCEPKSSLMVVVCGAYVVVLEPSEVTALIKSLQDMRKGMKK